MIRFLIAAACALYCGGVSALEIQITRGNCSPIVNLNFSDPKLLEQIFGPPPFKANVISEVTANIVNCSQEIKSPKRKLELFIFAVDQALRLKHEFLLPAYEAYEKEPTEVRYVFRLDSYFAMTQGKIEKAIEKYIEIDYAKDIPQVDARTWNAVRQTLNDKQLFVISSSRYRVLHLKNEHLKVVKEIEKVRSALVEAHSKMPD